MSCSLFGILHYRQCRVELMDKFQQIAALNVCRIYIHPFQSSLIHQQQILNHWAHSTITEPTSACRSLVFTAPGLGMGRHGTIVDWNGEGSPSMAAVPLSKLVLVCLLIGRDTGRHPLLAHPGPTAYGDQTERALRVWLRRWQGEGRVGGLEEEMPTEWSHAAVRGLLT